MENNIGAWFHQPDLQPPDLNKLSSPFNPSQRNTYPAPMGAGSDAFPAGVTPGSSVIPNFRGYQTPNPPNGWFYGLPRFRQNFNFVPNSTLKKEVSVSPSAYPNDATSPNQKRFIVFDQSGGQTTAIYSSGIRTHVPCLASMCPNISTVQGTNEINLETTRRGTIQYANPVVANESNSNLNEDSETEMRENTDEINALLYSTDEDEISEDEEEASTGHSPCVITANDQQQLFGEIGEEVASSFRPAKRAKLANDTASSDNILKCFDYEDDAESSCGDEKNDTRSSKDKIRETVSILQKILPLGKKDKDVILILDEAIGYLKSLKNEALDLGFEIL